MIGGLRPPFFMARTTLLEAVNRVLQMIGEAPIASLDGQYGLAEQAENIIADTSRQVQSDGWSFNTDRCRLLTRNGSNEIPVGTDVIRVVVDPASYPGLDVVQRGARLYDRAAGTYTFTQDVEADVTYHLPWDELPEYARQLITIRAGRLLQEAIIGSADLGRLNLQQEAEARAQFLDEESAVTEHSMLQGNPNHTGPLMGYIPARATRRF